MHRKFPSLEQFSRIYARETWEGLETRRAISYGAKIKLHGTNMGIRVHPEGVAVAQSRGGDLTVADDLHGFAAFVEPQAHLWAGLAPMEVITFYGEWAGPGINKGDAVQKTDAKRFYIFALGVGEAAHYQDPDILTPEWMITDPEIIRAWLPEGIDTDRVRVLPWENEDALIFDFSAETAVSALIEMINASVDGVAEKDPYISRTFGVDHPGEGFVLVPIASKPGELSCEAYARAAFKAKTEKHRVMKQGRAATALEPLPASVAEFVETFCTPQRVAQAIDEICQGAPDIRKTGAVLGWVMADIEKEAAPEIAALAVDPKRLKSALTGAARSHFMARVQAA